MKKFFERLLGLLLVWIFFFVAFYGMAMLLIKWDEWGRSGYYVDEMY